MKPFAVPAALVAALVFFGSVPVAAGDVAYRLSISESPTELHLTSGSAFTGERTLYLWTEIGASALNFGLETDWEIVSFTPAAGFINASSDVHSPYIVAEFPPLCIPSSGPFATLVVRDDTGAGGSVCFVPAEGSGRICFSPCFSPGWASHDAREGYSTIGPCLAPQTDCLPTVLNADTWGQIKSIYR